MTWTTPLTAVVVSGPSMVPTLRHGDLLVARRGGSVRAGDVVLGRFPDRPDRLVVKRALRPAADGWWLVGDNDLASDDSRTYGPGEVVGRVLLRYWPHPRLIRRGMSRDRDGI